MGQRFSFKSPPIFIAARMSSSRLPGKVLMNFGNQPLLEHVVQASSAAETANHVIVVTSHDPSDDSIEHWCQINNVHVWRGELNDVASRMLGAADHLGTDSFIRVSGDSPMLDPAIISYASLRFVESQPDLVTNVRPRSFPSGQSVEVVRASTLGRLLRDTSPSLELREHVTSILYVNEASVAIERFEPSDLSPEMILRSENFCSMTVDTPDDAACFRHIIDTTNMTRVWTQGWMRCQEFVRTANLELREIGESHLG